MNLLQHIKPSNLPAPVAQKDLLTRQREIILQNVLNILIGIYTVGFTIVLFFMPHVIRTTNVWLYLGVYLILAVLTINRRINYYIRAGFVVLIFLAFGGIALYSFGLSGTGFIFLFGSVILAHVLYNNRTGILFFFLALLVMSSIGYLMVQGHIPLPPLTVMANSGIANQWFVAISVYLLASSLSLISLVRVIQGMERGLSEQETLTKQLEMERANLEVRVEEHSSDLQKRVNQFEIASQIAKEIAGTTNLETLFSTAVDLIRERFGFYHVGVFLKDAEGQFAVLKAATGEAGQAMLRRNHRLKIGETGIVGYVVSTGEPRIAMNVFSDETHYRNPILPDTRSEMALPLKLGDQIIGALDLQSKAENAFTHDDVRILQTISDQLAIAFEKVRLVEELQANLQELERSTRSTMQSNWRTYLKNARRSYQYRFRDSQLENKAPATEHSLQAMTTGKPIIKMQEGEGQKTKTVLAVPIRVRNFTLGVVDIQFEGAAISPELISMIENTVDRLAVSLENARLLEEIQFRAERERLVGEITSKVRAASDVDNILRIAAQEIGKSLGVSEVMVQLRGNDHN